MITILGPTASGKTALAARLAYARNGEVISADSRQVYRGMNIGTGKDYDDYIVNGSAVSYHLIDIVEPGYEYNIYEYQLGFHKAYQEIRDRGKLPILCGGSGMYLESVLKGYQLPAVNANETFLKNLNDKPEEELIRILKSFKTLHNKTDLEDRPRILRAIGIAYEQQRSGLQKIFPAVPSAIYGISLPRGLLKKRITDRLARRLDEGMVGEVENLLNRGIPADRLMRYGLEYKFLALYITGKISREEMFFSLNKAIHQFSKRQMTWFRRMERQGFRINWIDGRLPMEAKIAMVNNL